MKPMKPILVVALLIMGMSTTFSQELFDAIKNNDLPEVKTLLESNPGLLSIRDESGNTPLHLAVRQKETETVSYLLGKGADVNSVNRNLQSPLHFAASLGSADIAKLLIGKRG